jgi:uncharacterized membrane protein
MRVVDAPFSSGATWIKQAFGLFIARPGAWVSLISLWFLLSMAIMIFPGIGPPITYMIQPALFAGFVLAARDQQAGLPFTAAHLFAGFRANGRALVTLGSITLLTELLVGLIFVAIDFPKLPAGPLGLPDTRALPALMEGRAGILMLGAGVVFLLMLAIKGLLWFATPLLALNEMSIGHAIRWSFYAFVANIFPLIWFGILMLIVFFLGASAMGLGLLVALPIYALAHYVSYQQVFRDD